MHRKIKTVHKANIKCKTVDSKESLGENLYDLILDKVFSDTTQEADP